MDTVPSYTLLGLDPGLAFTGFAIATVQGRSDTIESVRAIGLLQSEVDQTAATKSHDRYARARTVHAQLQSIALSYKIDAVAIEHPFLSRVNQYANLAAGMILGGIAALDLPTILVWPHQVKAATGSKKATKRDVIAWALRATEPHRIPWPISIVPNGLGIEYNDEQVAAFAEHPADALAAIQAGIRTKEWLTAEDRPRALAPRNDPR